MQAFQQNAGLYVDGIAGSDAEYLYSDDAPAYKEEKADDSTEAETTAEEDKLTAKAEDEEVADTGVVADLAPETQEQPAESTELVYSVGDSGEDVAKIQNRLISLNYLEGEADGDFGNATEEAVKGFQLGNDLAATGVIEQTTYDVLFSDSAVAAEKEEPATPDKEDDKAADTTTANSPAESGVKDPASTPTAPNTDVEVKTAELSSKSVAAVAESPLFKQSANGTNFEFIIWLGIMIVVMLIAFTIVYVVEKKKQKANQGRRYQ
ncbi:MAG: peptidoglycan-binding protein [Ruminococcus sp.]|nr:peptidoglycan-binding protein [Ruminococcus sp.]